jgi:predicted membrane protein
MRQISIVLRVFLLVGLLAGIASAVAAAMTKRRMTADGEITPPEPADNELDMVAIFDGIEVASTAPAFRHASVTAWYGGSSLDLRDATLDPTGASIDVKAIFGGSQLVVPETWRVEMQGRGIFGGFGDTRDQDRVDPTGPLLTVNGLAVFGGIGISSEAPELESAIEEAAEAESLPIDDELVPA